MTRQGSLFYAFVGLPEDATANKGEWSELYVFLRLLGEGRLYAADDHLQRNPSSYVEVLKVLREEVASDTTEYVRSSDGLTVEIVSNGEVVGSAPAGEFLRQAEEFMDYLRDADVLRDETGRKVGEIPVSKDLLAFSKRIGVSSVKAPALRSIGDIGGKTDIVLQIRDGRNAIVSTMGFSVKSQLSSPSTLYNAGSSTQFEYVVHGMNDEMMAFVNEATSWKAVSRLYNEQELEAEFIGTANPVTAANMFFVRESMADLMAWIYKRVLLEDYFRSGDTKHFPYLCRCLAAENPLGYPTGSMYEKVVKDFLFAAFAGMTGGTPWNGTEQINGGYIVVKTDGEVLCYHANDREAFRNYLFRQTFIEYVSRTKYRWGKIRKEEGRYVLPLNGSVRFNKTFVDE